MKDRNTTQNNIANRKSRSDSILATEREHPAPCSTICENILAEHPLPGQIKADGLPLSKNRSAVRGG